MRQRWRSARARSMARRLGEQDTFTLSPRARLIGGWVAAIVIIGGIALAVGLLGENGEGAAVDPPASVEGSAGSSASIRFGTALDPASGEVAADAERQRFAAEDTFAYSARTAEPPPATVFVEVERIGGGPLETVQPPSEQTLPAGASVIAFSVPASNLVRDFGPGEYLMRISLQADRAPIAEGRFEVVGSAGASP